MTDQIFWSQHLVCEAFTRSHILWIDIILKIFNHSQKDHSIIKGLIPNHSITKGLITTSFQNVKMMDLIHITDCGVNKLETKEILI